MARTRDFAKAIEAELANDDELRQLVELEMVSSAIAAQIATLRESKSLSQLQLGERCGLHQSAIARLEDSNYKGRSIKSLWKIADALDCRLDIRFVPRDEKPPRRAKKKPKVGTWKTIR